MDDLPALDKNKRNSIDVVVDRFKIREDLAQRLAESSKPPCNWLTALPLLPA